MNVPQNMDASQMKTKYRPYYTQLQAQVISMGNKHILCRKKTGTMMKNDKAALALSLLWAD
jgi:hypothetical protein